MEFEGGGLAGGLARGLMAGLCLGNQLYRESQEQQRRQRLDALEEAREQFGQGLRGKVDATAGPEADAGNAQAALEAVSAQKEAVAEQLHGLARGPGFDPQSPLAQGLDGHYRQLAAAEDHVLGHLYGPALAAQERAARGLLGRLRESPQAWREASPQDKFTAVYLHSGHDPRELVDNGERDSPVRLAGQRFAQALQDGMRSGDYSRVVEPLNVIHRPALQRLEGERAYDYSTVSGARISRLDFHPDSPRHVVPSVRLDVIDGAGIGGSYETPLMARAEERLAHPESTREAPVLHLSLADAAEQTARLVTLAQVLNSDAQTREDLAEGAGGGNDRRAAALNWLRDRLRRDPSDYRDQPQVVDGRYVQRDADSGAITRLVQLQAPVMGQPPPGVDASYDVPLAGGKSASADPQTGRKTTYIDRDMPRAVWVPAHEYGGQTTPGQWVDVHEEIHRHEEAEEPQLDAKGYARAHAEDGNAATRAYLGERGIDPVVYANVLRPHVEAARQKAEAGAGMRIPADLDRRPYEDEGDAGLLET